MHRQNRVASSKKHINNDFFARMPDNGSISGKLQLYYELSMKGDDQKHYSSFQYNFFSWFCY